MKINCLSIKRILLSIGLISSLFIANAQRERVPVFKKDGLSYYNIGNYSVATEYLSKWIKENPTKTDTTILAALADCYWKQRAYVQSFETYKKLTAVTNYSMPVTFRMRLSDLYAMQDKYKEASNELNGILELSSRKNGFTNISPFIKDSVNWSILYPKFNSLSGEYLPYLFENSLYITTDRGTSTKWSKTYLATGGQYSKIEAIDTFKIVIAVNTDTDYLRKHGVFKLYNLGNINKLKYPAIHEEGSGRLRLITMPENLSLGNGVKVADSEGGLRLISVLSSPINIGNKGSASFSKLASGITLVYFTGNILVSSRKGESNFLPNAQSINIRRILPTLLYKGTLKGDNIGNVTQMEIKGFVGNIVHATVSQDNKILVFSGKETANDNYDLFWAVRTSENVWDSVRAFGSNVNTIGNEVFPTLQKNGWLYFSSDGLPGLGALDIYKMPFYLYNTIDTLTKPEHLSYPLNSAFDDYGVCEYNDNTDKNLMRGFLSTNRFGSDDIYEFIEKPANVILAKGKVKAIIQNKEKKVLDSAIVKLYELDKNSNKIKLDSVNITDSNGSYKFLIKPNTNYRLYVAKEGWQNTTDSIRSIIATSKNKSGEILVPTIYLNKAIGKAKEVSEPSTLPKIAYNKILNQKEEDELKGKFVKEFIVHHYFDKTKIIKADRPIIDSVVNWVSAHKNASLVLLVSATDCYGSVAYNKALSRRRANHVKAIIESRGIRSKLISIKWVGKTQLMKEAGCPENKTIKQQQPNRYTKIRISNDSLNNQ